MIPADAPVQGDMFEDSLTLLINRFHRLRLLKAMEDFERECREAAAIATDATLKEPLP